MSFQLPKGTKDIMPEEALLREEVVATLKNVFRVYGFVPLETPIIERYDTLASKYGGGSEIIKETFKLKDQGNRELGLRYDLTVPLARFIAMNPQLKMPFKRYQVGDVFRDGPIKLGRYRQFTQCDVDIVGCTQACADSEIICLIQEAFKQFNLDVVIKVNNRKILNGLLGYAGVRKDKFEEAIISIDKLEKLGLETVKSELKEKGFSDSEINKIVEAISIKGTFTEKTKKLEKIKECKEGLEEIKELFSFIPDKSNIEFDISLARGLTYYTGTIIEVFLKKSKITSSVCAGGRFDKMIKLFAETEKDFPAVGISFGLDVILDALKEKGQLTKTKTKLYIIPINTAAESFKIAQKIRKACINADIDLSGKGISKNLNYASTLNIPFVLFIGEKELKQNKVKLRNMKTGKEEFLSIEQVCNRLA